MSDEQRRTDGWSSVPARDPGHVPTSTDGQEARLAPATSADGPAHGRVHGRPAPHYGEYAPEGWVNPVLVEQERREEAERSRALRDDAAREAAAGRARPTTPRPAAGSGTPAPGTRTGRGATSTSRFGASPLDFGMTVGLLVLGLWSVLQSLAVGRTASAVRETFERQYTAFSDPSALSTAAVVSAISGVVVFALVAWWSVRRLRARRWTFWVPLLGGVVATAISVGAFIVVVLQDPAFVQAVMQQSGA